MLRQIIHQGIEYNTVCVRIVWFYDPNYIEKFPNVTVLKRFHTRRKENGLVSHDY